jgi:RNA polymerase sigma factor (sigma-70 family)
MAGSGLNGVPTCIRRILGQGEGSRLNDDKLLERYVATHDEAAFAALVHRYGPMVLGVCERMLPDANDAEDAFQATFLVLVRRAAALDKTGSLGNWLYTVAYRTAVKARVRCIRRFAREKEGSDMLAVAGVGKPAWEELRPLIDEELHSLPAKQRALLVLYYLEGKNQQQVASALKIPAGSISRQLSKARILLRSRLARRGVSVSSVALFTLLPSRARAALVPARLVEATVRSAMIFGKCAALSVGAVSDRAVRLAQAVLHASTLSKTTIGLVLPGFFVAGAIGTMLCVASHRAGPQGLANATGILAGAPKPASSVRGLRWRLRHEFYVENVLAAALTRDGNLVALGCRHPQADVCVWDVQSSSCRQRFSGHSGSVHAIAFSCDGKLLASGSQDRTVKLWDLATGRLNQTLYGHDLGVMTVAFSPNSKILASGGLDRMIKLWNVKSGNECASLPGHPLPVAALDFSPDGRLLASASQDGTIMIWDVSSGRERITFRSPGPGVTCLEFSPDGKRLVTGSADGAVIVWNLENGGPQTEFRTGHRAKQVGFVDGGDVLAVEAADLVMPLWPLARDLKSGAAADQRPGTIQRKWVTIGPGAMIKVWHLMRTFRCSAAWETDFN